MIKRILFICCLFNAKSTFAQNDFLAKYDKQVIELDSLKKTIKKNQEGYHNLSEINNKLNDSIKLFKLMIDKLNDVKKSNAILESSSRLKSDSLVYYQKLIADKKSQFILEKDSLANKAKIEIEKGKLELLSNLTGFYKTKTFDELINSRTKTSVVDDIKIYENIPEIKAILIDLEKYFTAKELLQFKPDENLLNQHKQILNQIKRNSKNLDILKTLLNDYINYRDGLKGVIEKIKVIDRNPVKGFGKEIEMKKYGSILMELSVYIFQFDFNFIDYPHLSEIILEIIKRKRPNPDADLSDLEKKL